jgi:hypothetical protein
MSKTPLLEAALRKTATDWAKPVAITGAGLVGTDVTSGFLGGPSLTGYVSDKITGTPSKPAADSPEAKLERVNERMLRQANKSREKNIADNDFTANNKPLLAAYDKLIANDAALAKTLGINTETRSGKIQLHDIKVKLQSATPEQRAQYAREFAAMNDQRDADEQSKKDEEYRKQDDVAAATYRSGLAKAMADPAAGNTDFSELSTAYGGGIGGAAKAVWNHPSEVAAKYWDNLVNKKDVGTIAGTAAGTAAALFGAYGLNALFGGKKRKYAAAAGFPTGDIDYMYRTYGQPTFNESTKDLDFKIPGKGIYSFPMSDPATKAYYDSEIAALSKPLELQDNELTPAPAAPAKPQTLAGEHLGITTGSNLGDAGVAAGVGAVAVLGGVLLANKLRKSKKAA